MFELGVELQVLKRGTLFASRAKMLYDLYRRYDSLDALPEPVVQELEQKLFKQSLADVWRMTADYFIGRDPKQVTEAEADPKRKMALVFRAYLGKASHWANAGKKAARSTTRSGAARRLVTSTNGQLAPIWNSRRDAVWWMLPPICCRARPLRRGCIGWPWPVSASPSDVL